MARIVYTIEGLRARAIIEYVQYSTRGICFF